MDQIIVEFPRYPLKGQEEADVRSGYISNGKDPKYLPKLPVFVGGHTDFMIGVKHLQYYSEKVFQLPSGLTIYISWFKNTVTTLYREKSLGRLFIYFVIFLIILLEFVLFIYVCSFVHVFIAVFYWLFEKFK